MNWGLSSVLSLTSTCCSLRPLSPMVMRIGNPMRSASLNLTPGRSSRSSMMTSM